MDNKLAIIILAGGASLRMGYDKASLKLPDNQTLLDYMLNKYSKYQTMISGSITHRCEKYIIIKDLFDNRYGPVAGIISTLIYSINNYPKINEFIFIPIDLPCLSHDDLTLLINAPSDIAYFSNTPLPLKIAINTSTLQICEIIQKEIVKNNGISVLKFIKYFTSISQLSNIDKNSLKNINYPEEWEVFLNEYTAKSKIN